MVKAPPVPSSLTGTFLVSGGVALDFLLLPAELSGTFSMEAQHPEEVRLRSGCEGSRRSSSLPGLRRQEHVPWRQLLQLLPVELVGANQRVFLVGGDSDDVHRPGHLQHVVGVV